MARRLASMSYRPIIFRLVSAVCAKSSWGCYHLKRGCACANVWCFACTGFVCLFIFIYLFFYFYLFIFFFFFFFFFFSFPFLRQISSVLKQMFKNIKFQPSVIRSKLVPYQFSFILDQYQFQSKIFTIFRLLRNIIRLRPQENKYNVRFFSE